MRTLLLLGLSLLVACASGENDPRRPDGGTTEDGGMTADAAPDAPPGACTGQPDGTPCDADGDGCTMDLCRGGRCVTEGVASCDDGHACTRDSCRSTGPSTYTCDRQVTEGCFVGDACVAEGVTNPVATCQVCDTAEPTRWTERTGACDDGDACTEGDTCTGGHCVGTPRVDDYEPNDTRSAARSIGSVNDNESFPKGTIIGTLFPAADVDWYRYRDNDTALGAIFPRAELVDIPEGSNYDLCAYAICTTGATPTVACRTGAPSTLEGLPGCCSRSAGNASETVRLDPSCPGTSNDSVDVFVLVEKAVGPTSCELSYRLRWGDD
ncbi:MAG: hypothetical protein KF901_05405 [Myxococcales bacterium]|nr:hypothetical protein [Myxococcales bacterium]